MKTNFTFSILPANKVGRQVLFLAALLSFISVNAGTIKDKGFDVEFTQLRSSEFTLNFNLHKYGIHQITKDGVIYSEIKFQGNIKTKKKGYAKLPFLNASIQLSPDKNVTVEIISSEYKEHQLDYPVLPSRGVIYRNQDPSTIPYEIDPNSIVDAWYPENLITNSEPYIIRDVRGSNIYVYPFQYNAVKNILRVYKNITISIVENDTEPINPLIDPNKPVCIEMSSVYTSLFINYNKNKLKWSQEVGEYGEILVIYTSRDATVIQPWITWKKEKGFTVHEVQVSTGTNVKNTIQTEYNNNTNILYVQLVGDWADIKSDLGPQSAPTDPMLGCVAGADNYYDLIIGRFSANTTTHVTNQGNKTITYERDPDIAGTWYSDGLGIGSNEGAGAGDDGEADQTHIDIIKENKLLPFTYITVDEAYGGSVPASTVPNSVNGGVSIINYCGHGNHNVWVTGDYTTSDVSSATNGNKLPFIFSVACLVGEFHNGADCLAEAFLKKATGGAVGAWMATILQPWAPPMRGQDYANDILIQGYNYSTNPGSGTSTTYGKTTYGSITFNAGALMISESSTTSDWDTYETWTVFGDANVQVRTEAPKTITLSNETVTPATFSTTVTVDGSPFENAIVSLYKSGDPQPFASLTDASGNATINHTLSGTVKLTVTGFNLATYYEDKVVTSPTPPVADFVADQTTVTAGTIVNFTDLSTNFPTSWSWTFNGGTPGTSTDQNPSIAYNTPGVFQVSLTATNTAGSDTETKIDYITVNPVADPPVADFVASETNISIGQFVDFTDLTANLPDSWSWTFEAGTPGTSTAQNPTGIVYNSTGTFTVTLEATNAYGSDTEIKTGYINVEMGAGFSLDFEDCADYSYDFTPWTVNDVDGLDTYGSSDCDFPGEGAPMAYIAFNPTDAGFALANAHGGVRCGMSICPSNASASNDWLISEQLSLLNNSSITFWVLSPKPGSWGNESYNVAVSTTNNNPASFTVIAGPEIAPDTWTERVYDLSAYDNQDVYIAVQHVSVEKFMFWIDDISIYTEPAASAPVANFIADNTAICVGSSLQFTNLTSDGDSYSWTFAGGTPPSSTDVNPLITYDIAGTYTVELTATNAYGSDTATKIDYITVTDAPTLGIAVTDVLCNGGTNGAANLTVTGGTAPFTYSWSSGETSEDLTDITADNYTVTVTDYNGCIVTESEIISEPEPLTVIVSGVDESSYDACDGSATATPSGGTPSYSYLWSDGQTTSPATALCSGDYFVTVTDANDCYITDMVTISFPDDIADNENSFSFNIYPNPNNGIFSLEFGTPNTEDISIEVLNISNQIVLSTTVAEQVMEIDMRSFAKGVYFVKVLGNQFIEIQKIIIL